MSPARQSSAHEARVSAELLATKPRPAIGYMNGYCCLWLRPGDVHCLAAGEVTATVQIEAHEAIQTFLAEPAADGRP